MNRLLSLSLICLLQVTLAVASTFNLTVEVTPDGAGSLNVSSGTYEEGSSVYLRTYANTGYVFQGWYEGDSLISTSSGLSYSMPSRDMRVQARYEYDPSVPGNPSMPDTTTYYTLTTAVTPDGAGSVNRSEEKFVGGASVYLYAYTNTGFNFLMWKDDKGDVVSTNRSFNYTMPYRNANITAVYEYDPSAPANPDSMGVKYTVTLACKPVGAGSFNTSSVTDEEGSSHYLYAYNNTGFKFVRWEDAEGNTISTDRSITYVIPHGNSTIYGVYEYDPDVPSNPNKNYWNSETGEVIVDDFTAGNLSSAISSVLNGSSSSNVSQITVSGKMSSNDFGFANNYSNCSLVDLSRTYGYTDIPSYAFDYTNLSTIILPSCVESIGYRAFYQCTSLSSVSCYSMVPPTLGNYAFTGIADGAVLYVPAAAIPLYQEAEGWKDYFSTVLPLQDDVRAIEVTLPADASDGRYKDMTLELLNAKTGQKQKYVISDRTVYTFNSLLRNSVFNVYVKNASSAVLGQIDSVSVTGEDVKVAFESLLQPQNVSLSVLTPDGTDVTSQVTVTWLSSDDSFLKQASTLTGQLTGTQLKWRATLPQTLAMQYVQPADSAYTVEEGGNAISYTLTAIAEKTISGTVKDAKTDSLLSGAAVSITQTLNGKYSKSFLTKTNADGKFSQTVFDAPTKLTVSATDYVSLTVDSVELDSNNSVGELALKTISGATIDLTLTYTNSVKEGTTAETTKGYADYTNIDYTLYNVTQKKSIDNFSVQYPTIVLLEEVAEGDCIRITATSKKNAFATAEAEATIDANDNGKATLSLVELGGITASYGTSDNAEVVGMLYDSKGFLLKTYSYADEALSISELADGSYSLLTMGSSSLFNSILKLDAVAEAGLVEGTDYALNKVTVKSGVISNVIIKAVPKLDENKLYYTGDGTTFTVNKSSIVAGNYLTFKGTVDFKSLYASEVDNVKMVIDLPESCSLVENSAMVGSNLASYTVDGTRLTIPMDNYSDAVRFCVIPTEGGEYTPNAFVQFTLNGNEVLQPIGSAFFEVKNLTLNVSATVATLEVPVTGTALGSSTVTLYDNNVVIGQTKATANGSWKIIGTLVDDSYLSEHSLYAVSEKNGLTVKSDVKTCVYNSLMIKVAKVTMVNTAHPSGNLSLCEYITEFDFLDPKSPGTYWYWPNYPDFSFKIQFTKNDTCLIHSVKLRVKTSANTEVVIPATYSVKQGCWTATHPFYSSAMPRKVSVDYNIFGADLTNDATYDAVIGAELGDYTVNTDSIGDGYRQHTLITEKGDTAGVFVDKIEDRDIDVIAKEYIDSGYVAEVDTVDGKILFNPNDSSYVYLVPGDNEKAETRYTWIFWSKSRTTADTTLIRIRTILAGEWEKHIARLIDCEKGESVEIVKEYTRYLNAYLYKIVKTWVYQSVFKRFENDSLVYEFRKKLTVITNRYKTIYKDSIYSEVIRKNARPYTCEPQPDPDTDDFSGDDAGDVQDPSGYVYEAVSSNRLQGVTATAYYKETVEDMYGDLHENVVLWDASEYAQENPLFTDENGMYQWDVPQGLWQVKFEKEGYQTVYSEWLPVPPPQLEVNIAMTQNRLPEVKSARAYEGGLEVEFDKYMLPETMTTDNIYAVVGDSIVDGQVTLLNEEKATEGSSVSYVSKVRFVPTTEFLTTDEVTLTVSRKVKSYAGIQMETDYTQQFDIEKEVKSIAADSLIKVAYNGDKTVTVSALPYDAAIGKLLVVKSSSPMIATISTDTLTLDENGQATLTLTGELPGMAVVTYALQDADVSGQTTVQVVDPSQLATQTPTASRASGTAVYRNTVVELACETENATIYYTTDGSCPCDENGTRKVYDGPIAVTDSMTIKAMAIGGEFGESEVAEFTYTIKKATLGLTLSEGWNWVSHDMESAIPATTLKTNAKRIVGQTAELVNDPALGLVGNLSELSPVEAYKVEVSADTKYTLDGYEYNAATPLELYAGWNWIGYPLSQTMSVAEAFAYATPDDGDYIVGQDGLSQYTDGVWTGTLQTLVPGVGYMYNSKTAKQMVYNTKIVSKAKSLYGKGLQSMAPWVADKHAYPNIMGLVANVYNDGSKADAGDYTVGAFCGTECRGVGQYVDGKLMMNIYGEGGETITFVAIDNETDKLYDINESETFTETLLGSVSQPYSLNIGGEANGISSSSVSGLRVWPNVVSDRLFVECKGESVGKVTLTDMGGNTVVTAKGVKSGNAVDVSRLPDGVYIVTATANGETCYKKIVKIGR